MTAMWFIVGKIIFSVSEVFLYAIFFHFVSLHFGSPHPKSALFILKKFKAINILNLYSLILNCYRNMFARCHTFSLSFIPSLLPFLLSICLLLAVEYCWNVYPSTVFSSLLLHCCHATILLYLLATKTTGMKETPTRSSSRVRFCDETKTINGYTRDEILCRD